MGAYSPGLYGINVLKIIRKENYTLQFHNYEFELKYDPFSLIHTFTQEVIGSSHVLENMCQKLVP